MIFDEAREARRERHGQETGQCGDDRMPTAPTPGLHPHRDGPRLDRAAVDPACQVVSQVARGRVSLAPVLLEAGQDNGLEMAGNPGVGPGRWHGVALADLVEQVRQVEGLELGAPRDESIDQDPQRIDVRPRVGLGGSAHRLVAKRWSAHAPRRNRDCLIARGVQRCGGAAKNALDGVGRPAH